MENFGLTLPLLVTVIASPADPQENNTVPEEPGTTWVKFASRLVEPVPQFATIICGRSRADPDAKTTGSRTSVKSIDAAIE